MGSKLFACGDYSHLFWNVLPGIHGNLSLSEERQFVPDTNRLVPEFVLRNATKPPGNRVTI